MDDLSRFCCLNAKCPARGKRGAGNLTVCARYGRQQRRLLYCRACKARFSERKGTPLFQTLLPDAQVAAVLGHIVEGCGVRQTARLTGVNRSTVGRLSRLAGDQAQALHEEFVAFSPSHARGATGRKMGLRGQKRKAL
jgi:LacI family transcriptional regulator